MSVEKYTKMCPICYSDMKEEIDRYICTCGNTIFKSIEYSAVLDEVPNFRGVRIHSGNMQPYEEKDSAGIKQDKEKLRLDLIPADVIEEVAKVYTYGASKYGDRNWEKGLLYSRPYGAALRHIITWWKGENLDDETGVSHLAHAICELEFLLAFELRKLKKLDDRPYVNITKQEVI